MCHVTVISGGRCAAMIRLSKLVYVFVAALLFAGIGIIAARAWNVGALWPAAVSAAGLNGAVRGTFISTMKEQCLAGLACGEREDCVAGKMDRNVRTVFCACVAEFLADRLTVAEISKYATSDRDRL